MRKILAILISLSLVVSLEFSSTAFAVPETTAMPGEELATPAVIPTAKGNMQFTLPAASTTKYPIMNIWAGYADTVTSGNVITSVQSTFTVPTLKCRDSKPGSSGYAIVDHWVGIDGWSTRTVEQDGVEEWCTSTHQSSARYAAWYTIFGTRNKFKFFKHAVVPRHKVTFTAQYVGSKTFDFTYKDDTLNKSETKSQTCHTGCGRTTAEVITEDPGGGIPDGWSLVDFGKISYSNTVIESGSHHGTLNSNKWWTLTGKNLEMSYQKCATCKAILMASPNNSLGTSGVRYTDTWDATGL